MTERKFIKDALKLTNWMPAAISFGLAILIITVIFNLNRITLLVYGVGGSLTHGPIVGAVTSSSAQVWLRTSQVSRVKISYRKLGSIGKWTNTSVYTSSATTDYTVKIPLSGLVSNTSYEYTITVDGFKKTITPNPTFKTFVAAGRSNGFKFVILPDFRKAQETAKAHSYTFASASSHLPDFGLIIGDHDHNSPQTIVDKRLMFKRLYDPASSDMADYVNLVLRKFPLAMVWDDHDYGMNNGDKTYALKALSLQVLQEMFPTYPVSSYGDWQSFSYGQADFFMLDRLSQADPSKDIDGPDKSLLDGDNLGTVGQLQWLYNGLKNSTAKWKFVVTPVVFNPTPGKQDSWAGYLIERQNILNYIVSNNVKNVIFLSADIHFGAIDNGTNSGKPELLSPPVNVSGCVTSPPDNNTGIWSEGIYDQHPTCWGFGYVEVKTNPDQVILYVKDQNDVTKVSYTVNAQ